MEKDAGHAAMQVLAQLPAFLDRTDAGLLCLLLSTSKSLHDRLLQPSSCKHLVAHVGSVNKAAAFAEWLGLNGSMLQAVEVKALDSPTLGTCEAAANRCIVSGIRSIFESHLRVLRMHYLALPPSLLKAASLRGLEELQLTRTGGNSLRHLTSLTKLTSLTVGNWADTLGSRSPGLRTAAGLDLKHESCPRVVLPASLRKLDGVGFKDVWKDGFSVSHLTNLTRLRYSPWEQHTGCCPALPAAHGMKALRLDDCHVVVDAAIATVLEHMTGLSSLYIHGEIGHEKLRKLCLGLPELSWLYVQLYDVVSSFEAIAAVACATGLRSLWLCYMKVSPVELKPLSSLTRLTSLSLYKWQPVLTRGGSFMYGVGLSLLGSALPHLVHLAVFDNEGTDSGRQLEALGLFLNSSMLPALQMLSVPLSWVADPEEVGADCLKDGEAALPVASQQLLAQLRHERPGLVVKWWLPQGMSILCKDHD